MRAVPTRPQIPCVFSCKMRLAFLVTVNSYDPRPTAPGIRIFFQLKRPSRKPFQSPCVFSRKRRLACNVPVNLNDPRPTAPTFLDFSKKTRVAESASWVHKLVFIQIWRCQPLPGVISFSKGKRASQESPGSFKAGTKAYVDQGAL